MQMRPASASSHADFADGLALFDDVALLHEQLRAMQERAVQAHAVVDHQQMPFQRKGVRCSQRDDAVGWRHEYGAGWRCDIHTAVIAAGRTVINTLRAEQTGNAASDRAYEFLPPAIAIAVDTARGVDAR